MKRIILAASLILLLFITSCAKDSKYKYKYVLDMSNQEELISFLGRQSEDKENYEIKLLSKKDDIKFEGLEINFEFIGEGIFNDLTYKGKIDSSSEDYKTTIKVSIFISKFSEPVVLSAKGYLVTNTEYKNYTRVEELDEDYQLDVKNELKEKINFALHKQVSMTMDFYVKANGNTNSVKQEIAMDMEQNYLHMIVDDKAGIILIEEEGTFILYNYSKYLLRNYLSAIERVNISSITDYEDYDGIEFIIEDNFTVRKIDEKYLLETTFRDFLTANNQAELIGQLGKYAENKIVIEVTINSDGFKMAINLDIEEVNISMSMNYKFGNIKKIDTEKAIILGDSVISSNNLLLDEDKEMKNQLTYPSSGLYYRYQLEEGYYFFNAEPKGDYSLIIMIYDAKTGKKLDVEKPKNYYNLNYDGLYQLPKGDYIIGVYNGSMYIREFDFRVENLGNYQSSFNVKNPDYTDPVGDVVLNFESKVDVIAIKFTASPKKTIRLTFEEHVYNFPKVFDDNWFNTVRYTTVDNKTFDIYIDTDSVIAFQNTKKGQVILKIEIIGEVLNEPLNLLEKSDKYMIADNNIIYTFTLTEDSYLSLNLTYNHPDYNNPLTLIFTNETEVGSSKIVESYRRNTVKEIFLKAGTYTVTTYSSNPFNIEYIGVRTE